jgi:putative transposase
MKAFSIRLAKGMNRLMRRRGPVLEDRCHAHVLRTPAEVRRAVE